MIKSPFVSLQTEPRRIFWDVSENGPSVFFKTLTQPAAHLSTITEVEDWIIAHAQNTDVTRSDIEHSGIGALIMRTALLIASASHRGMGNVVLMNTNRVKSLMTPATVPPIDNENVNEVIGRWTKAGTLNDSATVWGCNDFPDNKIVVAYVGASDEDCVTAKITDDGFEVFDKLSIYDELVRTITLVSSP